MIEIRLTPTGNLRWEGSGETPGDSLLASLRETFAASWCEGLFLLAAGKADPGDSPNLRYWQGIAECFLMRLCHLPERMTPSQVEQPSDAECAHWVLTAPPMPGGEYLSAEVLLNVSAKVCSPFGATRLHSSKFA